MCAAQAEITCNQANSVYKDSEHVKDINGNRGSIGSLFEFCGAFYHVPGSENGCLDTTNCIIGKRGKKAQPLTAVALVKFKLRNDRQVYKRYTNCSSNRTHAEEYFVNDVKANICSSFRELEEVTMYITMQPCHKSVDTEGTKEDWSCCDILIDLAKNELKGVKIVIKPTHISKAGWDKTRENRRYHNSIDNAEKGIKNLMRTGNITLSRMEVDDWKFFFDLFKDKIQGQEARQVLDNTIENFLKKCQKEVKEKRQKDMEPVADKMNQLHLSSRRQNKKKE